MIAFSDPRTCSQDLQNPVERLHTAVSVDVVSDRYAADIQMFPRIGVPSLNESVDGCISIQLSVVFFAETGSSMKSEGPKVRKAEKVE